jgi:superfamily I DNA/RNA helicase
MVNGVDPQRIMLLTFTRRAAIEMTRRVKKIIADSSSTHHHGELSWSGTAPRRDRVVDATSTVKKMWAQRAR